MCLKHGTQIVWGDFRNVESKGLDERGCILGALSYQDPISDGHVSGSMDEETPLSQVLAPIASPPRWTVN